LRFQTFRGGILDDIWQSFWVRALRDPFRYPVDGQERIFWFYLLSSLILALGLHAYLRRNRPDTVPSNPFAYLFPRKIYLHKSAIADYQFFLIDRVMFALMLPVALVFVNPVTDATAGGLTRLFGPLAEPWNSGVWVTVLATLSQIVLTDFLLFYLHYLFHKVPVLWEFHKVHHSAEVMTPLTAYRMHPVEVVIDMNVTAVATGILLGIFVYLTGGGHPGYTAFGVNIVQVAFYVVGFNLRHSHVPLGYGSVISQVLVSPWMHQVHHSRETRHLDTNMGFIFSFWDRLFGTLYVPKSDEADYALGLTTGEHVHFHGVLAMYFRPFANLARRWLKPAKTA
jgi:sterol desaturase/sphingolipid hydroxylase (fatty acid hydroxylase superfamily)